jgi:transketolase
MRNTLCKTMIQLFKEKPYIFLTGDLGFMALEDLQATMKDRFINAGVAEQNMVTVAAGIASTGLQTWVYSIAPFVYARPFEQIRNDICLHNFDVKLVGNGGGYAYGSMGSTHHALEDYGVLLTLQNMQVLIPAFSEDIQPIVQSMSKNNSPSYLRLGKCEKPETLILPKYSAWRKILSGEASTMIIIGALAGSIIAKFIDLPLKNRPEVWVVSELPLIPKSIPEEFLYSIEKSKSLHVVEEHVSQGSAGHMIAHYLLSENISIKKFEHFYAKGYLSGYYGSQNFHREECGLDPENIAKRVLQ